MPESRPQIPMQPEQVRHQVLNALTVLQGRAFLLRRRLQIPGTVAEREQAGVLADLAALDSAVLQLRSLFQQIQDQPASYTVT